MAFSRLVFITSRISDPLSVYQLFPKQQQAFDFSKTCEQVSKSVTFSYNLVASNFKILVLKLVAEE